MSLSFSWKGISSAAYGVCVKTLPYIYTAALREDTYTVPGRDGVLHISDMSRDQVTLLLNCYLPYGQIGRTVAGIDDIRAWLTGEGWFTQSNLPGKGYKARITDTVTFQPLVDGFQDIAFSCTFYADPYKYVYPEPTNFVFSTSGIIANPGSAAALPLITVQGNGDIILTIGMQSLLITGLSGSINIDCDAKLAYWGSSLLNNKVSVLDEWPSLLPGNNVISWTGSVSKVTIAPGWRYL